MRFPVKLSAILFIAFLLCGCDSNQYQVVTGSDGALYRFNKKTGALSMIIDDKNPARPTQPQTSEATDEAGVSALDKPISWEESKYPGKDLSAKLEMVWRENKLCYKFSVYPYKSLEKVFARKKQDYIYGLMRPGFTLELLDKNGFLIKEIKINLWNMTKVDDDSGVPKELISNSQVDCTERSYRSISGYTIKWGLDGEMIDDEGVDNIESSEVVSKS